MECNATCNDADEVVAGRVMRSVFTEVATQKEWIIYGVYMPVRGQSEDKEEATGTPWQREHERRTAPQGSHLR